MPISLSYISSFSGSLGAVFPVGPVDDGIRALQRELVRLGYLQNNTGPFGADGFWGPRMALALRQAAAYVGWTEDPYLPANADSLRRGEVTIPDELIARIRAAAPDPNAVAAGTTPATTPAPTPPPSAPSAPSRGLSAGWIAGLGIGAVMLTLGAIIAMKKDEEDPETLLMGLGKLGRLPSAHLDRAVRDLDAWSKHVAKTDDPALPKAWEHFESAKMKWILAGENINAAQEDPRLTPDEKKRALKLFKQWLQAQKTMDMAAARLRAVADDEANMRVGDNYRRGRYV